MSTVLLVISYLRITFLIIRLKLCDVKTPLIILAMVSICAVIMAQDADKFILDNATPLESGRYEDITGSPYLFDDFKEGKIVDLKGKEFNGVPLNFNGYSLNFEVRRGDNLVNLDEKNYRLISFEIDGKKLEFNRGIDAKAPNRFLQVLYRGKQYIIVKDFKANLQERKIEAPNKTLEIKKFIPLHLYYIAEQGQMTNVKLTRKGVSKVLGKGVEQYAKRQKINLGTEEGLIEGLKFYEKTMVEGN